MILIPRQPRVILYARLFVGWIWECVAVLPWHESWRVVNAHYVASLGVRATENLERGL